MKNLGEGNTAWSAVINYVKKIRGKIIVLDVMTNHRRTLGEGSTAWSAVINYMKRICGKIIVLDVMTNHKRTYGVPHNLEA